MCLLKCYCVLYYTVSIERVLRARSFTIACYTGCIEGYCVLDYTVSIERLLRARLYCVYGKVICVLYTVSSERLLRARLYCCY